VSSLSPEDGPVKKNYTHKNAQDIVRTYDNYPLTPNEQLCEVRVCVQLRCYGLCGGRSKADIEAFTGVLLLIAVDGSSAHVSSEEG
jgi:hypothetical protein